MTQLSETESSAGTLARLAVMLYAIACYAVGFLGLVGLFAFLANWPMPGIDRVSLYSPREALVLDLVLVLQFGLQHSVMARGRFKDMLCSMIPCAAERATYVAMSGLSLALIIWLWRPIAGEVWTVSNSTGVIVLWALFAAGMAMILAASFMIDHFDLFGLRQAWFYLRQKQDAGAAFKTPLLYAVIRHPIQLGVLLTLWAAPTMSLGHLLFALTMTVYVFVGLWFEERDLVAHFGQRYVEYSKKVGGLLPRLLG